MSVVPKFIRKLSRQLCWILFFTVALAATHPVAPPLFGQDPIWNTIGSNTERDGYFRHSFQCNRPDKAEIHVTSSGYCELYINGRRIKTDAQQLDGQSIDVLPYLKPGTNVIACKVSYSTKGNFLQAKLRYKEPRDVFWKNVTTDTNWRTYSEEVDNWQSVQFTDLAWAQADVVKKDSISSGPIVSGLLANLQRKTKAPSRIPTASVGDSQTPLPISARLADQFPVAKPTAKQPTANHQVAESSATETSGRLPGELASSGAQQFVAPAVAKAQPDLNFPPSPSQQASIPSLTAANSEKLPSATLLAELSSQPEITQPPNSVAQSVTPTITNQPTSTNNSLTPISTTPSPTNTTSITAGGGDKSGPGPDETNISQFTIHPEFEVKQVLTDKETGSVIAMAFNEFGQVILSREGGPLMLADIYQPHGSERVREICSEVNTCQGILCLNGNLYVTGNGPEGMALYELVLDSAKAGKYKIARTLVRFMGPLGEHGPHGLTLGPDGMIYVIVGNASSVAGQPAATSPLQNSYDADLVPRNEDPSGHAAGIKAPGGTVIRVALDEEKVEVVAGGIRNAYDLAFNATGDLFIHDSDMESDIGLSWYRPTSLYHVPHGADLGWRSGWAKMPTSYPDTINPIATTGRGSPTGIVSYRHLQYPTRFHDTLFLADWSEGRILWVKLTPQGASYKAQTETFMQGKPLNVTDLDVGEDGSLYFTTGGRGTGGGMFRIQWRGKVPDHVYQYQDLADRIAKHPQPNAAWARQNLALIQQKSNDDWTTALWSSINNEKLKPAVRSQLVETYLLYNGLPTITELKQLSQSSEPALRARVAQLCGFNVEAIEILNQLLDDSSLLVRRHACEAFLRLGQQPSVDKILQQFKESDRTLAAPARQLLARVPAGEWTEAVLNSDNKAIFVNGAIALVGVAPEINNSYQVLAKSAEFMKGYLSDPEFNDLLRVVQLALVRGSVNPQDIPAFVSQISAEFPTQLHLLNEELIRILAYLQSNQTEGRYTEYLQSSNDPAETKVLVAMYLAKMAGVLDDDTRLETMAFLHRAQQTSELGSYLHYLMRSIRELAQSVTLERVPEVIRDGHRWVDALAPTFYRVAQPIDESTTATLIKLDATLKSDRSDTAKQARLGIIALLATSETETSQNYLRQIWRDEPGRRNDVVIGLAHQPEGKNWSYLVSSFNVLDEITAEEILTKLNEIPMRPTAASHYRELLELGYRMQGDIAWKVNKLLQYWSAEETKSPEPDTWQLALQNWQQWYHAKWPNEPQVAVPTSAKLGKYTVDTVLAAWQNHESKVSTERGLLLFTDATCVKCHRLGVVGDSVGPDLSGLSKRFSKRELVESIIHPSQVIPDRYRSTLVLTSDGISHEGMLIDNGDSITILDKNGRKTRVAKDQIESQRPVDTSAMPANLLDSLKPEQIADLLAYLYGESPAQLGASPALPKR